MVSFWPWRGGSSSTASFEKTLSTLSAKIATSQSKLDRLRSSARRIKVLWTLYLTFAYLVYAIVLLIVVGYKNMGSLEWAGFAAGPVIIYGVRALITAYFNFRIEASASRLKEQQEERAKTIQQLKDATKYDSTLELLEKYGGADGRPKDKQGDKEDQEKQEAAGPGARPGDHQHPMPGRTNMPPPPTANIPRPESSPGTPQPGHGGPLSRSNDVEPEALYAPNAELDADAYTYTPRPAGPRRGTSASLGPAEPHWYDRIFDVLLGDDETAPKNRIVLICRACRLVNGQAPPGTKSLSELGTWKCMACGAPNGEMDEGRKIVKEVLGAGQAAAARDAPAESESAREDTPDVVVGGKEEDDGPAASVRKRRGKGKK
jgi:hypothetical protein